MSTTRTLELRCPGCGREQTVLVAESANAARHAKWRTQVLDGTFMRFGCACGESLTVEHELLYTDVPRKVFIGVFPQQYREDGETHAALLGDVFARTSHEARMPDVRCRAVFGYAELREKLVCFEAGLDDRVLEATKLALYTQNRDWTEAGSRGLLLIGVEADGALLFRHLGVDLATRVDREVYERTAQAEPAWRDLLRLGASPWVSLARWSQQP